MAVRLAKPWLRLDNETAARLAGQLGVYELANALGEVVYIGAAGGRSLHGLRGEIMKWVAAPPAGATQFRYEVNMAYRTRQFELLGAFRHDHGRDPVVNRDRGELYNGRLRPS
ncbi:MAG: hypothetical protein U1E97_03260 [Alphaproteobacteria bacterium]